MNFMNLINKFYIMIIFFHNDYHWHIIECNSIQIKINVIKNFFHLLYEEVKIKHFHFINDNDEILELKIILINKWIKNLNMKNKSILLNKTKKIKNCKNEINKYIFLQWYTFHYVTLKFAVKQHDVIFAIKHHKK